jgi:hypothetical protein
MNRSAFCSKGSNFFDGDAFSPDMIPEGILRIAVVPIDRW